MYVPEWNKRLMGDREKGYIYEIKDNIYTDNGDILKTVRRTGHITHGTNSLKKSHELRLRIKRGVGSISEDVVMMMRWRDDNGEWGNEQMLSLGKVGDKDIFVTLKPMGFYHSRQYEFSHTDNSQFVLIDAEELIEVIAGR